VKKILISTGGSGGHVFPAIAFFEHLTHKFDIQLVTDIRGSRFLDKNKTNYKIIDVTNIFSKIYLLPINLIKFIFSILKAYVFMKKNKFDILISTGGHMSFPLCIAAKTLNIEIILLEPNMILGRANKFMLKFSKNILCYSNKIKGISEKYLKKIIVIPPVLRKEIYALKNKNQTQISNPIRIIIMGGSQGATFFDTNINKLILNLSKNFKIEVAQQVYNDNAISILSKFYNENKIKNNVFKFDNNLIQNLKYFDLAITRSGASAINELCQINIPFLAIPFPYATDNHQSLNAKYYNDLDACWMCEQSEYDLEKMTNFLRAILQDPSEYFKKKENLNKISYQNTWNNINQKLTELINEN
tara:strand:- start:793 stop:1869 length:1077 start_codon:yes stop_codon:yes gene_type:complete